MNKTYRIVWSTARQAYVVADEKARARGKSSTLRTVVAAAATAMLIPTAAASAASLCGHTTNTITGEESSQCQLGSNSSVEITSTGSINMGISYPVILAESGVNVAFITNAGALTGAGRVIALDSVTVSGKVWNKSTGTITGSTGINVKDSTVQGGVVNDGKIISETGIGIDVSGEVGTSQVDNGIVNNGTINTNWGINVKNATVNGGINNTGTIALGGYGIKLENGAINGAITNSGSISGVYSGIYIDDNSVVSSIKNNGSIIGHYQDTSSSYSVALYVGSGSQVLSIENNGTISGDRAAVLSDGTLGSIVIGNNAKFIGDVRAAGTDVRVKSGATFENTNAFDVKSFTVEQGATFNITEGLHTFQQFSFMPINYNDGIKVSNGFLNQGITAVAPGAVGTIHGDYTQADSGTLRIGVASDTSYGKVVVDGTATLGHNAKLFVDVKNPNYSFTSDRLQGVLTAETLQSDGTFSVADNSLLFDFDAVKKNNSVDLTLKKAANLRQIVIGQGNNPAVGAAGALDQILAAGASPELTGFFGSLGSQQEISDAVTQTLPLLTGASTNAASGALSSINRVIQARMDSNAGLSSGDGFLTDKHLWLKPFGSWADQDNRGGVAGYNADTMGFAMGTDAALNDKVRVGLAFAYANADVDGASKLAPQSMDVDVYQLIGYGSYSLGANTELNFQVDVGQNENSGKRYIELVNATAKSDYRSFSTHVGAGIGHTLSLNEGITFTPSARLDYTAIRDEGYSEKGAGAVGLDVSSNRTEELIASVDGKFNLKVTDNTSVALNLGVGYDVTDNRASITAAYAGAPGFGFTTYGIEQNRWLLRSGIGLTHTADNGTEITARYDNEGRSGFSNQTASVKVRWAF